MSALLALLTLVVILVNKVVEINREVATIHATQGLVLQELERLRRGDATLEDRIETNRKLIEQFQQDLIEQQRNNGGKR